MPNLTLFWFRQDLRLSDNPGLTKAAEQAAVLPVYIFDDKTPGQHRMGAASRWWLHHSLKDLNNNLNGRLQVFAGNPEQILPELAIRYRASAVYWNRCYEPWRLRQDQRLEALLTQQSIAVETFNAVLLWEPWTLLKNDGSPYRVFTPFFRNCCKAPPPREPVPAPASLSLVRCTGSTDIDRLRLLPDIPWDKQLAPHWQIGETGAQQRLRDFLDLGLDHYQEGRNLPGDCHGVSRLSPHLHFGEISPNQLWSAIKSAGDNDHVALFCRQLAWREFSYSLLYYHPDLPENNLQRKFDAFPWREDPQALKRWQTGQTGYPIVDAGMRELWQTGYMHNRVRMIVGSFLVKNLLLHWHAGEQWFWDCLVDADLANNSASWQWIAGCGADAAPYFRIFNPITQGQKFDPHGRYTRKYLPELARLPDKFLFNPFQAPTKVLAEAGISLGETYPEPVVALKPSRARALAAFKSLGKSNSA